MAPDDGAATQTVNPASAIGPLRTLESFCARFGNQLVFILPDDAPRHFRFDDFDMDATRLQRQLELMHLLDVFGGDRLEPGQPGLSAASA